MSTKINITQISEEYRGYKFFNKIVFFPWGYWIDWSKM